MSYLGVPLPSVDPVLQGVYTLLVVSRFLARWFGFNRQHQFILAQLGASMECLRVL